MTTISYLQAIRDAQLEEMRRDERVFIMGEDVAWNMLGSTEGFVEEFGPERVRNTPITEAAFTGAAAGAAMVGMRPIVDLMLTSFMYCAMDQIISIISKSTYLYGGQASLPLTIRASMFYGGSNAAQHSDRPLAPFMASPGLKIIAPSSPYDAKGLLKAAIREDDPVISFEDGTLWTMTGEVPDEDYIVPLGQADVKREGSQVTVVAISGAVRAALTAAGRLAGEGISVEVVDPRSLVPMDYATILSSVAKTGRLVVADPSHRTCSPAAEIAATVAEDGFWSLQAPIVRVTTPDTHIPFSPPLEAQLYPGPDRIAEAVRQTLK
jgi:acetoin:2,6-dichlorophenolindophenol oxidoreductase subunit beta